MAQLDPSTQFEKLKTNMIPAISELFPIIGKRQTLRLDKVWVDDSKHLMDLESQKDAKIKGKTWAVPVYGDLSLIDNVTGKVLDKSSGMRLISLPKITHRFSYIVGGKEYQVLTQFLRRPGVYAQVAQNGELVAQFNLAKKGGGENFDVRFDPTTRQFSMSYRGSDTTIKLYPILQAMGVPDKHLEDAWGKEILAANVVENPTPEYKKLFRVLAKRPYDSDDNTTTLLNHVMSETVLDPETTKITLGKAFDKVEGDTILRAASKLLGISRNETQVDDMHSLVFKRTHAIEDFIPDRLRKMGREIKRRINLNLDRKSNVAGVMSWDILNRPVHTFFTSGSVGLAFTPEQVNPLEMMAGQTKTTIMGAGGIGSEFQITQDEKSINPSHLGFLDPVHTPESSRIGASLSIPLGAEKKGNDLVTTVHDLKIGKDVQVKPYDIYTNMTVFPDQVTWKDGKPVAVGARVKAAYMGNMEEIALTKARYVFKSPRALFGVAANLIPFMQNNMGTRAVTGSRQQEQAISLLHREAPLVQSAAGPGLSFEKAIGNYFASISPAAGEVTAVDHDSIVIKSKDKKTHKIALYNDFPMNDNKSYLSSTPTVKKGDSVTAGQVIADTNYTKGGVLALGTNLVTAYIPYKGYNFEDGIVISESAAKKLSSLHMHRIDLSIDDETMLGKSRFIAHRRRDLPVQLADKLDDEGIIKKGQKVQPGDVLVAALQKRDTSRESALLTKISRGKISPFKNAAMNWSEDYEGEVADVIRTPKQVTVFVKTTEAAQVGDKIVGRHGNKGIITLILPDSEMPQMKGDKAVDILLNPAGVPGRVNLGQILETAVAKVAQHEGKPILVQNFDRLNQTEETKKLLSKHGLTDREMLYDPETKRPLGQVLVGPQYMFKLKHQVGTKLRARSTDEYDINHMPQRGGEHGGQSLGTLGIYALLAHGARANLREMATFKSDYNADYWHAIQSGEPLPPPRPPFTFDKLMSYIRGAGINVHKDGNSLILMPLTDDHVKKISAGQLPNPAMIIRGKDLSPIKGGLFDYNLTGGPDGSKWSHIKLTESMPNPVFEGAIKSVIGITAKQYDGLIRGTLGASKDGKISAEGTIKGGKAFDFLLGRVDVNRELTTLREQIKTAPVTGVDRMNRKIKILGALQSKKLSPTVYILRNVPVLPPKFRPLTPRPDGTLNEGDLNGLYKNLALVNESLATLPESLPDAERAPLRGALYDAMKALTITGMTLGGKEHKGIIDIISGSGVSPKAGFFQSRVIRRRQDLTMRSTIVPEPKLGLDEVGIPEDGAWELYKPFIQRRLRQLGIPPLRALDEIKNRTPQARASLDYAMRERPVLVKRDPVLHKFGVLALKPVLHKGKAIQIHPLVTSGFGADFDGDTMSIFVPLSEEAVREAHSMFPSNNLLSSTTGLLMNNLSHESLLGTYMLSEWGRLTASTFKTREEALKAAASGSVHPTDVITVGGTKTTVGRLILAHAFPVNFKVGDTPIQEKIIRDKAFVLDKSKLNSVLTSLAKTDKDSFATTVAKMQNIGSGYAYSSGFSIGISDLAPVSAMRDKVLSAVDLKVQNIRKSTATKPVQDKQVIQLYDQATQEIEAAAKKHFEKGTDNNMYKMVRSGARGNWDQFKQMVVAPMLVRNSRGDIVPVPIKKSYSEGLDTADYWTALHGVREGIVQKVIGTSKPGAFSKVVMSSTIDMLISGHDCGTEHGSSMSTSDLQILGRFLAQPVKIKDRTFKRGTLVDSDLVTRLENNKVGKIIVRSPLRCEMPHGICQICYGLNEYGKLHSIGTNIGALAGHSIGEPATQLALKAFHEGGVAGASAARKTDAFTRINQILEMPKIMPNASVLSKVQGPITKIETDPAGGWSVYVGPEKHYVPAIRELVAGLKVGTPMKKGQSLTDGDIHPVDLLNTTNMSTVQEHLTNELFKAYRPVGPVRRVNIETVVKAITGLAHIEDPGDHPDFIRGDMAPVSKIIQANRTELKGKKPIVFEPVLRPITQLPLELSTDWLAKMNYRRLKDTLVDGAQRGWQSAIHQSHPMPGLAYAAEFGKGTKAAPWLY